MVKKVVVEVVGDVFHLNKKAQASDFEIEKGIESRIGADLQPVLQMELTDKGLIAIGEVTCIETKVNSCLYLEYAAENFKTYIKTMF